MSYEAPQGNAYQTQPVASSQYVAPYEDPRDSVGAWMIAQLISAIPLVGFIYLIVLAVSSSDSTSPARRNWARAMLMWQIVVVVALVLFFIIFGAALLATFPSSTAV